MSNLNSAELLTFSKSTAKIINKLVEARIKGKIESNEYINKLKILKNGLNRKFDQLEKDDSLQTSNDLKSLINEFLQQKKIINPLDAFFQEIEDQEKKIRNGDLTELQQFCESNKTLLKETKSDLKQKLITQIFINLVLDTKRTKAIEFVRKNNIPSHIISKWFRLLIDNSIKYKKDLDLHIEELCNEFRTICLFKKGIPQQTRLTNRIIAGIISFNNIQCMKKNKKSECPTCLPWIQQLAVKLPYSKRNNTFIRCIGCQEEINELNQPLLYESKWVYSEKYLKKCGYIVYCKKTDQYFEREPKIVYFL